MISVLIAFLAAVPKPPLFIENDPRLRLPCSVMENRITLKSLVQRIAKSSGVKLTDACDFPDPVLKVFVRNRSSSQVLQMLADALDLDWQSTKNGWRLFRPVYVKAMEDAYDQEAGTASVQAFRNQLDEWRGRRDGPILGRRREDAEQPVYYGIPETVASLCLDGNDSVRAGIENGETVVGCTTPIPGAVHIASSTSGVKTQFVAVRLDRISASLQYSTWEEGSGGGKSCGTWQLADRGEYPVLLPSTPLARRNENWFSHPIQIREALMKHLGGTPAEQVRIQVTSSGMDLSDALADRLGLSMILVSPPGTPIAASARPFLALDEASATVSEALCPGLCRVVDGFLLWRPVHYRYRADIARPLPRYSTPASREPTAIGALLDTVEQTQACRRSGVDTRVSEAASLELASPDPSLIRLTKGLSRAQLNKVFYGRPSVRPDGRFTDAKVGIAVADLDPALRKLALNAMRSQLLLSFTSFQVGPFADWVTILNPTDASRLRFVVAAQRRDSVRFDTADGGVQFVGLPTPRAWDDIVKREGWESCSVERFWIMEFVFGVPGGPAIRRVINQRSVVLSIPASEVKRIPEAAFDRVRRTVSASTGIASVR